MNDWTYFGNCVQCFDCSAVTKSPMYKVTAVTNSAVTNSAVYMNLLDTYIIAKSIQSIN